MAMFLEAVDSGRMAQNVEPPRTKFDIKETLYKVAAPLSVPIAGVGAFVKDVADSGVPAVPSVAKQSLENVNAWKSIGKGFWSIGSEATAAFASMGKVWPYALAAIVCGGGFAFSKLRARGKGNEQAT
jgi:hypothetical protein